VTQRFEYFNTLGMPLRARLTVSFRGNDLLEDLVASIPLLSADRTKRRVFRQGESLQQIAAEEYADPRSWRPIAEASSVDNPLTVAPGTGLTIPTLT